MSDVLKSISPEQRMLAWIILSVTIFIKFAIPVAGYQFFLAVFMMVGIIAYGFTFGYLTLHSKRFLLFLMLAGVLISTQLLGGHDFSVPSVMMLLFIHVPYIFRFSRPVDPAYSFDFFQKLMVFVSIVGILQYFGQYVIGSNLAFPLDFFVPEAFFMQGYNGLNELTLGGEHYKSNGVFIQEPSNMSQLLALGLIIEGVFYRRWKVIALFLFALAVTFSGTGIMVLMMVLPIFLLIRKRFLTLLFMIVLFVSAPVWAPYVGLERTVERATEFTSKRSSGYARFISPIVSIDNLLLTQGWQDITFGLGAGFMGDIGSEVKTDYETAGSTWGKIVIEYGLIGALMYLVFMSYILMTTEKNFYIVFALVATFLFMGEYLFPPTVHFLMIAMLVWAGGPVWKKEQDGQEEVRAEPMRPSRSSA